jgi:formate hydrogenlyase subunit 4
LFAAAPVVVFTAYTWLAFGVPVFARGTLVKMDLIVLIYVLGLARFSLSLAGLDAGASFGGLGSSREMFFHVLTEAGLVLVWAALALHWKTIDLSELVQRHNDPGIFFKYPQLIFPALSFGLLIIMEAGLIPVDNPDTHLELTMSRKAITLEFAGRDLALIEWAEMIKLLFLVTLFSRLFLPFLNPGTWFASSGSAALLLDVAGFFFQAIIAAAIISIWELQQPKMRLRKVSSLAWFAMLLSLVMIVYVISSPGAGGVKP